MTIEWFSKTFKDVKITPMQRACCVFLQREGLRFCVDFGYQNAERLTWDRIDAEMENLEWAR